jgi:hypothetical protein
VKETMNLTLQSISVHISRHSLTCHEIIRHGADGFTSRLMEGVLLTFITLKNPLPLARTELANLESNSKHANHYKTQHDLSLTNKPIFQ